jgi:hypothetical protein
MMLYRDPATNESATRGSETLPSVSCLDLALAYNYKVIAAKNVDIRLAIECFNVFSSQPMTIIENRKDRPAFGATNHQQPRALQFSCRVAF